VGIKHPQLKESKAGMNHLHQITKEKKYTCKGTGYLFVGILD
jgi:hypothetical protein